MSGAAGTVFTLPLVGRVGAKRRGGGRAVILMRTPTPNPSPQGGGEPRGACGPLGSYSTGGRLSPKCPSNATKAFSRSRRYASTSSPS